MIASVAFETLTGQAWLDQDRSSASICGVLFKRKGKRFETPQLFDQEIGALQRARINGLVGSARDVELEGTNGGG